MKITELRHVCFDLGGNIGEKPTIIAPKAPRAQEPTVVPSYLAKKVEPPASGDSAQQVSYPSVLSNKWADLNEGSLLRTALLAWLDAPGPLSC